MNENELRIDEHRSIRVETDGHLALLDFRFDGESTFQQWLSLPSWELLGWFGMEPEGDDSSREMKDGGDHDDT